MKCFVKRFLVGCAMLSCMTMSCYADDITDDYYDIAKNYYKEGNTQKALEYINQILDIDNNNIPALSFKVQLTPPTFSKRFPDIDKPLVFDVPYVLTGISLSDLEYKQGLDCYRAKDYLSAEEHLRAAVKACPENFRAYNTLGLVFWAENKLSDAKEAFLKSNNINQSFTIPLDNLAQVYKQIGSTESCLTILKKAQTLNGNDFCSYLLLGDYYREKGDIENALTSYRDVIRINQKYNLAYLKIAKLKTDNMDFAGSNATLNYYLTVNPKDDYAYYLLAKNYEYMNNLHGAKESILKAILMCNCREYRIELGKIDYKNEDIQEALEAFNSALTSDTPSEVYNYIGMCYYYLHDFNKAIVNINRAIEMPDIRILYYYNLAQIYETLKDNLSYSKYMDLVKNYTPKSIQDYIDMSGILLGSDSKNSAIKVINEGIEKYPRAKELYLEKLKIYDLTDDEQGMAQTKADMENIFK